MTPKYTRVGYAPVQPVPYSHALHVGQLGLDCRYCHSNVEKSGVARICRRADVHELPQPDQDRTARCSRRSATSYAIGDPVPWSRVHQTPDYVYFNHAAHVNRGVSCVECHGQINEMDVVDHAKSLSMGFCLDCHRNPDPRCALAIKSPI